MKFAYWCVWWSKREKEKSERAYDDFWKVASVCVFLIVVWPCERVSKRDGLSVVNLWHSVHQRRSVLFVLLHPSVSDGSLMVMARQALAAGADATLGWGRPRPSSPPWGVLHAALVVTVYADLWEKVNKYEGVVCQKSSVITSSTVTMDRHVEPLWGFTGQQVAQISPKNWRGLRGPRHSQLISKEVLCNLACVLPVECLPALLPWGLWYDEVSARPTACLHLNDNRPINHLTSWDVEVTLTHELGFCLSRELNVNFWNIAKN